MAYRARPPPPAGPAAALAARQKGHNIQQSVADASLLFGGGGDAGGMGADPFSSMSSISEAPEEVPRGNYNQQAQGGYGHSPASTSQPFAPGRPQMSAAPPNDRTPRQSRQGAPHQQQRAQNMPPFHNVATHATSPSVFFGGSGAAAGGDDWLKGLSQADDEQAAQSSASPSAQQAPSESAQNQYYDYSSTVGEDVQQYDWQSEYDPNQAGQADANQYDANGYNYSTQASQADQYGYGGSQYDYGGQADPSQPHAPQQGQQEGQEAQQYDYGAYQYDQGDQYGYDAAAYQNGDYGQAGQEAYGAYDGSNYQAGGSQAGALQSYGGYYDYAQHYEQSPHTGQDGSDANQYGYDYAQGAQQDPYVGYSQGYGDAQYDQQDYSQQPTGPSEQAYDQQHEGQEYAGYDEAGGEYDQNAQFDPQQYDYGAQDSYFPQQTHDYAAEPAEGKHTNQQPPPQHSTYGSEAPRRSREPSASATLNKSPQAAAEADPYNFFNQSQQVPTEAVAPAKSVTSPPSTQKSTAESVTSRSERRESMQSHEFYREDAASASQPEGEQRSVVGDNTIVERDVDTPGPPQAIDAVDEIDFEGLSLGQAGDTQEQQKQPRSSVNYYPHQAYGALPQNGQGMYGPPAGASAQAPYDPYGPQGARGKGAQPSQRPQESYRGHQQAPAQGPQYPAPSQYGPQGRAGPQQGRAAPPKARGAPAPRQGPAQHAYIQSPQMEQEYGAFPQQDAYGYSQTQPEYEQHAYSDIYENGQGAYTEQQQEQQYGAYDTPAPATSSQGDDPLSRQRQNIPLFTFSANGQLVTHFPRANDGQQRGYGFASGSANTTLVLQKLSNVVPTSTFATHLNPSGFPGPLYESSASNSALTRATGGGVAQIKAKKSAVIQQLNNAVEAMSSGLSYLTGPRAAEGRSVRDRIVLLRILACIVEHDGAHIGNPVFDQAAVEIFLSAASQAPNTAARPIPRPQQHEIKPATLAQLQDYLSRGKRQEAVTLARESQLWTHAVIIASGLDKETWRAVVQDFMEAEFGENSQQSLKVAYSLFSGQEPKTFYDVFRPKATFEQSQNGGPVDETKTDGMQWCRAVAMILANRSTGDSAALTAIGDGLAISGHIEAAHTCYLLSPQTSALDSFDTPGVRYTLIGAHSPQASSSFARDLDGIMLTEIFEFALGLRPQVKGAEPFQGLAFLQSYRALHALSLAEMGEAKKALKYCDAIAGVLKGGKMNRHFHTVLLQTLQELQDRLSGDGKAGAGKEGPSAWLKRKPTVDVVWGALEGRFTKFIAGEDEATTDKTPTRAVPTVGPFSHYSAITPDANSGGVSRVGSFADFNTASGQAGPKPAPPSSATFSRPDSRSSSGRDAQFRNGLSPYMPSQPTQPGLAPESQLYSDWPQGSSADAPRRSFSSAATGTNGASTDTDFDGTAVATHTSAAAPWAPQAESPEQGEDAKSPPAAGGPQPYYGYEAHGADKASFESNVDEQAQDEEETEARDIISPMDAIGGAPVPTFNTDPYAPPSRQRHDSVDAREDDDLGFGNTRSKSADDEEDDKFESPSEDDFDEADQQGSTRKVSSRLASKKEADDPNKPKQPATLKTQSSWLGRIWGGRRETSEAEPKAKRAHLGEETSFYYDKDLKRWVNKKAGDVSQASTPPPPPPRSASGTPSLGRDTPPPSRSTSAYAPAPASEDGRESPVASSPNPQGNVSAPAERVGSESGVESTDSPVAPLGPAPTNTVTRQRSKLADHSQPPALQPTSSRPSTAIVEATPGVAPRSASAASGGPPMTGSLGHSAAKKKPINKRYVRVD